MMDAINKKMGKDSVTIAATGTKQRWPMRRDSKSPYTQLIGKSCRWREINCPLADTRDMRLTTLVRHSM